MYVVLFTQYLKGAEKKKINIVVNILQGSGSEGEKVKCQGHDAIDDLHWKTDRQAASLI